MYKINKLIVLSPRHNRTLTHTDYIHAHTELGHMRHLRKLTYAGLLNAFGVIALG